MSLSLPPSSLSGSLPPTMKSLPSSPLISSVPSSPKMMSSPSRASMMSFPVPLWMMLSTSSPITVSSKLEPMTFSVFNISSVPPEPSFAWFCSRLTFTLSGSRR